MIRLRSRLLLFVVAFASSFAHEPVRGADEPLKFAPEAVSFFQSKVKPLLETRCFECHAKTSKRLEGGLRLDARAFVLKGGDTGSAAVPGKPDESLLIKAVNYQDFEMPPRGRLPEGEVAILRKWVELGLPWSEDGLKETVAEAAFPLEERKRNHWAWQPIKEVAPPAVKQAHWPLTDVDRFILAKLEEQGLSPSAEADRRALIRRASFALTGLPPRAEETDSFVNDPAPTPKAFEKVVDRLLASPQFGEHWARHWLDLARYGETLGHEFDYPLHHASRYRDYVIRAFNADVPYNQFVTEQLAGDLLQPPRLNPQDGTNESIIGTGFWFLGELKHAPVDVKAEEAAIVDNQVDVFAKTFLALTVNCARCHDHKFDPITMRDYYALSGFLQSSRRQQAYLDPNGRVESAVQKVREVNQRAIDTVHKTFGAALEQQEGRIAVLLQAAREVLFGEPMPGEEKPADAKYRRSSAAVARQFKVSEGVLDRWVAALSDESLNAPTHPLFGWKFLGTASVPAALSKRQEELAQQLAARAKQTAEFHSRTTLIDDFEDGRSDGWFATGWAFGDDATQSLNWRAEKLPEQVGAVSSLRDGRKLRGVLRSSDFTITKPTLLYRLAGQNVRVRLIIDGYVMDEFSGLLFGGCRFDVNNEKLHWHRQAGDVRNYVGERAHIELIDEGDGWIVVDEIRLADDNAGPTEPVSAINGEIAATKFDHPEDVSKWYAKRLAAAASNVSSNASSKPAGGNDSGSMSLANWIVAHDLITEDAQAESLTGLAELRKQAAQLDQQMPAPDYALAITDGSPEDEHVFIRGSHKNLGPVAERRMLEAISGDGQPKLTAGSGRLELARRLLDPSDPFPARVMANRVWHHVFGRGIVESVDNFGVLGKPPTHPELLDWLATQFVRDGWSNKKLIRQLLLSRVWQMSSAPVEAYAEKDPDNLLWHRALIRRLEGESIRDAMLAVSGRLDLNMLGPSVPVHLTAFMQGRGRPGVNGPLDGNGRRSIYISINRNFLSPMMLAFDAPIPFTSIGRRNVSNVPAQALILMNDPFVLQQAGVWADRELKDVPTTPEARIADMYLRAFSRPASEQEVAEGIAFLQSQAAGYGNGTDWKTDRRVWGDYAHVLFNVKEFVFVK